MSKRFTSAPSAIGKIQSQFSLAMIQSLEAEVFSIGQPVHAQQPLIGLVGNRNPMGRGGIHSDDAHAHDRVVLPRLGISLVNQARVDRRKIHERAHGHAGLVGLQIGDRLRIGRPPIGSVMAAKYLFPIDPGEGAIQRGLGTIVGELCLLLPAAISHT